MKLPDKKKNKKQKMKMKPIEKSKKEKVMVVAQEFKFARLLSGNEKKTRDRVLKTFKKWLMNCFEKGYEFKEDDFIRVWKGLFYAVWMSDKPLVQEDLCESISEILDLFPPNQLKYAIMMTKAGFKVLATEWYGIDQHRMDKFLMLVRRYLRGGFRCLLRCNWSLDSCKQFSDMLSSDDGILAIQTPQYARNSTSMILHIIDCYLEELSKVSKGKIPEESVTTLLFPFCQQVCLANSIISITSRRLLTELIRQSDLGLEYDSVTKAWQKMGCPPGGPDALVPVSDDEEDGEGEEDGDEDEDAENGTEVLDPRAGRVHAVLRPLPVPAAALAARLRALLGGASSRGHRRGSICLQRFEELSQNKYPLKVPEEDIQGLESNLDPAEPMKAASRLSKLEKNLVKTSDELALRGLSRKHRKRLLAKTRAGVSVVEESDAANGDWRVEDTEESEPNNDTDKENKHKKKSRKRKLKKNKEEVDSKKAKISESSQSKINIKKSDLENECKKNQAKTETETEVVQNNVSTRNRINAGDIKREKEKTREKKRNREIKEKKDVQPKLVVNKAKNYQKQTNLKRDSPKKDSETPKKVKFVLKNNSMQGTVDYYKSVRQSPSIPFDSSKKPSKTNLKPSMPSPINPFWKKAPRAKRK